MLGFAGWNLLNVSTSMITLYSMNLIINHFYGAKLNAAMGIATQLTGVLMAFSLNMQKALTPAMMKSEGAHERDKVLRMSYLGSRYAYIIFAFWGIPIFFFIDCVLKLWLKEVPFYTNVFCKLLIISILIEQYFVFLNQTIQAEGTVKQYNLWRAVFNVIPIFSSIIMCSFGCEPSWVIVNRIIFFVVIGGIINIIFCKKNLGLNFVFYFRETVLPTIIPTILLCLFGYFLYHNNLMSDILSMSAMLLMSFSLFFLFSVKKSEKKMIFQWFK
jgi:Na+-driven multidrug efflux pump